MHYNINYYVFLSKSQVGGQYSLSKTHWLQVLYFQKWKCKTHKFHETKTTSVNEKCKERGRYFFSYKNMSTMQ